MIPYPCAGIILAGGQNRRMQGKNKALLTVGRLSIIERQIRLFEELFQEVILVSHHPLDFASWDGLIVGDILPHRGSLIGVHAGLFYARSERAFIAACDMPFIKPELVRLLVEEGGPQWDVVVPVTADGYQPLFAVYSKRCLQVIEDQVQQGAMKISRLYGRVKVKKIPEERLREVDPELISFFNINTDEDWQRSQSLEKDFGHDGT